MGMMDFIKTQEWTTGPLTLDEMIKLFSVIENPQEADNIRKALRFYDPPGVSDPKVRLAAPLSALHKYANPYPKEYLDTLL